MHSEQETDIERKGCKLWSMGELQKNRNSENYGAGWHNIAAKVS
jgi:hypothetical protein